MNRRQFLAASGVGVTAVGGVLGWRWFQSPSLPDGMRVETWHHEADALSDSAASERGPLGPEEQFHVVLPDRATATDTLKESVAGAALDETDFETSYLLVVQTGMQSKMELVLQRISRRADGLDVAVSVDSPDGGPDDLRAHSLLVRITDNNSGIPETVTIDITGYI